eukprot:ANDGO_06010.mRNA.1 putative protein S-acyltransferase 17
MLFFVFTLLAGGFLVYILLVGGSEDHDGDWVGSAYDMMNRIPSSGLRFAFRCLGGRRGAKRYDSLEDWVLNRRNPLMAIVYNMLIATGYFAFVYSAQPLIPNPSISSLHIVFTPCACAVGFNLFLLIVMSNPGVVTAENVSRIMKNYPYDGILYGPGAICPTCKLPKPARSKHCKFIGRCVSRYDHYCPWFFNTIGENNLRWFILFLYFHSGLCVYGAYVVFMALYGNCVQRRLFDVSFVSAATGEAIPSSNLIVLQYVLSENAVAFFLFFALAIFSVVLFVFASYHMWLIRAGTTTNETYKWSSLYKATAHDSVLKQQLRNAYDRGWLSNFREVFWPLTKYSRGIRPLEAAASQETAVSIDAEVKGSSRNRRVGVRSDKKKR